MSSDVVKRKLLGFPTRQTVVLSSIALRLWFQHAISTYGRNWDLQDDHFAERCVPEAGTARISDELLQQLLEDKHKDKSLRENSNPCRRPPLKPVEG